MSTHEKEWFIGIDFGTVNTYIVAYENKSKEFYLNQSSAFAGGFSDMYTNIPTVITANKTTEGIVDYYCGQAAVKYPFLHLFRGLKNAARQLTPENGKFGGAVPPCEYPFDQCGKDTLIQLGNNDEPFCPSAKELVVEFFKKILNVDSTEFQINKDTVKRIVIGRPVCNTENGGTNTHYEKTLEEILTECFVGKATDDNFVNKIVVAAESELAGTTFLCSRTDRVEMGNVLVIDIGGGTTDFSILSYKDGKVSANNLGNEPCNIAGNAIDDYIFSLLPEDSRLKSKVKCKEWKEHLFADAEGQSDAVTIIPKDTKQLEDDKKGRIALDKTKWYLSYNTHGENTIVLSKTDEKAVINEDKKAVFKEDKKAVINIEGKDITTIEDIFNLIADKLTSALNKWKENNKEEKINKILFVGGTSIITPLRESLIEAVNKCGFDVHNNDVVTPFDTHKGFTLSIPKKPRSVDKDPQITLYNAVAIGALIKALGDISIVRPHVEVTSFSENKSINNFPPINDTNSSNIIIPNARETLLAATFRSIYQMMSFDADILYIKVKVDGHLSTLSFKNPTYLPNKKEYFFVVALIYNKTDRKRSWKAYFVEGSEDDIEGVLTGGSDKSCDVTKELELKEVY